MVTFYKETFQPAITLADLKIIVLKFEQRHQKPFEIEFSKMVPAKSIWPVLIVKEHKLTGLGRVTFFFFKRLISFVVSFACCMFVQSHVFLVKTCNLFFKYVNKNVGTMRTLL